MIGHSQALFARLWVWRNTWLDAPHHPQLIQRDAAVVGQAHQCLSAYCRAPQAVTTDGGMAYADGGEDVAAVVRRDAQLAADVVEDGVDGRYLGQPRTRLHTLQAHEHSVAVASGCYGALSHHSVRRTCRRYG